LTVTVRTVSTRRDERAFIELPYQLHSADPGWVPPLRLTERRRWSHRHNPSLQGRIVTRFLACRGSRVVGRIAAVTDPLFQRWQPGTGFFGFFEAEDDAAVAAALLDAAESALAARGAERIAGPVNLSTHDEVGFLVEGFGHPPMLLDPSNPPSYPRLVEQCGYVPLREYHAYLWNPSAQPSRAVRRLLDSVARRGTVAGVRVRPFRPDRWDEEVRIVHHLYNECFADVWGFVPISASEIGARAEEFRAFYLPRLVLIAEAADQPVGFVLALPDANAALALAHGRLLPLGWLRIARALRSIRTARLLLLGVVPAFRGRGVAALLAGSLHEAGRACGITSCELSLVQGTNDPVRHLVDAFRAPRTKTFRLYGREIGGKV
jgi:GNAT superfamily N-acetyltransferase